MMHWIKVTFKWLRKTIIAMIHFISNLFDMITDSLIKSKINIDQEETKQNNDNDIKETGKYIEELLGKNINDITLEEIDMILNYNKATTYINEEYISNSSRKMKKGKTHKAKNNNIVYLKTGIIEMKDKINDEIYPCMPTVMDTKGLISLISVDDGTREGITIQLSIPGSNDKIKIAPNHIAAMDNITTWYKYNENISIDKKIDDKKISTVMKQINISSDIDSSTEVFFAMSNSKDGLVGIMTKPSKIYKTNTKEGIVVVSIVITLPKVEIKGAISGCPIITNNSIFIASAARSNDQMYQIFATSINYNTPLIVYRNKTTLQSKSIFEKISSIKPGLLDKTNMYITEIINISSYPSGMLLNYLSTETSYKTTAETKIRPLTPTVMVYNDRLKFQILTKKMILIIVDYDDTMAKEKISWIMQIAKNIYRVHVIDLNNVRINNFENADLNEFNTISYHVNKSLTEKQNYTNIANIPNETYVSVYTDMKGLATYTGIVRVLSHKGCKIRLVRLNLGEKLDIDWTISRNISINKNVAEDSLVADETNWRFKTCYLNYIETPYGPIKLTRDLHKHNDNASKRISKRKTKTMKKVTKIQRAFLLDAVKVFMKIILNVARYTMKLISIILKTIKKYRKRSL